MEVPSPQQLLEAWLCLRELEEKGLFCPTLYSDSTVFAPVLAWGSELQPCSHTSCGTAKALRTPPPSPLQ